MGQENSAEIDDTSPNKQSPLGIASFAIGLVALALAAIILVLILTGPLFEKLFFQQYGQKIAFIIAICMLRPGISAIGGLAVGIAGAAKRGHRKVFSILGIVFSCIAALGVSIIYFAADSLMYPRPPRGW